MFKSLKTRLILVLFIYLSIVIVLVTIVLYKFYSREINDRSEMYFIEKIDNTVEQLETIIEQMDTVSIRLLSSHTLQGMFFEANKDTYLNKNYFEYNIEKKKIAQDILWSYNSPKTLVENVNIVGGSSYLGLRYSPSVTKIEEIKGLYEPYFNKDEYYVILPPHVNPWDDVNQQKVISLIRPFIATGFGFMNVGIIEVQEKYSVIQDICNTKKGLEPYEIVIIDKNGNVIFSELAELSNNSEKLFSSTLDREENLLYTKEIDGLTYSIAYSDVKNSDWRVIMLQSTEVYTKPLREMLTRLIIYIIGITIVIFAILILIVNKVIKPLKQLVVDIDGFNLEEEPKIHPCDIKEIKTLQSTFVRLVNRLQESADKLLIANETELNLRIMTMQAQINPHFLYNSLTAISSVASEEGSNKVPLMCYQLSEIFRYTSSSADKGTTLKDEINNIRNYMAFVKWRYETAFEYEIEETVNLESIPLPKLVLQPFIENCFAHGFKTAYPPYRIKIICKLINEGWYFKLTDNGGGFDKRVLEELEKQIKEIDKVFAARDNYDRLKALDKAILNIYIRLKLIYKDKLIFNIGNNVDTQGAFIEIATEN